MRKYLVSAAILTLLAAPSAWSDPPDDHGNRGHEGGRAEQGRQGPPQGAHFDRGNQRPQASVQAPPNRGDQNRDRGPAPQVATQAPPNRGNQDHGFDRGYRGGAPQVATQAPPDRGDQYRGFDRGNRGPAPQAAIQAPPTRGDNRSAFNDNRGNPPTINRQASRDFNRDFNRDGRTDFRPGRGAAPRHDFSGFRDYHRNFQASRRFQVSYYRRPAGWYAHRWAFGEFLPAAFWVRDYWLVDFALYDLPPPPFGAVWVRVDHDALLIDEDSGEIITVAYDVFY